MKWKEECLDTLDDEHLKAILSIQRVGYLYDHMLMQALKPFGLSVEQFDILNILNSKKQDTFNLKQIQFNLVNQTKNTTRLVEKLKQKELISSNINPNNRRQLDIKITQKGLLLLKEADKEANKLITILKELYSKEEMRNMTHTLTKIIDYIEQK